jgi:hypothetical protein
MSSINFKVGKYLVDTKYKDNMIENIKTFIPKLSSANLTLNIFFDFSQIYTVCEIENINQQNKSEIINTLIESIDKICLAIDAIDPSQKYELIQNYYNKVEPCIVNMTKNMKDMGPYYIGEEKSNKKSD